MSGVQSERLPFMLGTSWQGHRLLSEGVVRIVYDVHVCEDGVAPMECDVTC